MLTIQEVGKEILTNTPRSFYVLCGAESGLKDKYISHLKEYYGNSVTLDSFDELVDQLSYEPLISVPTLYIIRYDKDFWSKVSATTPSVIDSLYIDGTVVMIYSDNANSKLSKFLGEFTIDISPLSEGLKIKYLTQEFPQISSIIIEAIVRLVPTYLMAQNICNNLSYLPSTSLGDLSIEDIKTLFVLETSIEEKSIYNDIQFRNVPQALLDLDRFDGELSHLLYVAMNVMVSLDKQGNRAWDKSDIVLLNELAYRLLLYIRTNYVNLYDIAVVLFSAMGMSPIPQFVGGI